MAITTLDGALAGMQGVEPFVKVATPTLVVGKPQSLWGLAGNPGAGAYTGSGTPNGANLVNSTLGAVAGAMLRADPVSGNAYVASFSGMSTQTGTLMLCDRLWQNGVAATVTTQAITQPTLPARDNNGTTNGDGVLVALEVAVQTSTNAPVITLTYTDSAGAGPNTSTNVDPTAATASVGSFFRLGLAAGDAGVRSVTNLGLSLTWTAGTYNLVAYRVVAVLPLVANIPNTVDALTGGFSRIYNGACLFLVFVPTVTTAPVIQGAYIETQG